jgi:hypothetical protein
MVVKEVTVSKGVTISIGKFESVRVDASAVLVAEKGEDPDMLYETGFEVVDEQINKQIAELQDVISDSSVFHAETKKQEAPATSRRRPA